MDPVDPAGSADAIKARLRSVLQLAREKRAFVTLDMESYSTKDITLRVFKEILTESEFADWPDVGLALQAYLRDTDHDLADLIHWVRKLGVPSSAS